MTLSNQSRLDLFFCFFSIFNFHCYNLLFCFFLYRIQLGCAWDFLTLKKVTFFFLLNKFTMLHAVLSMRWLCETWGMTIYQLIIKKLFQTAPIVAILFHYTLLDSAWQHITRYLDFDVIFKKKTSYNCMRHQLSTE